MKLTTFFSVLLCFSILFFENSLCNAGDSHTNQITIGSNRVFELNGQPFFPILVNHELGSSAFNSELKKGNGSLWGFNVINLHLQTKWGYSCSGYNIRNVISGDLSTGSQYYQLLNPLSWNITYRDNANRIFTYCSSSDAADQTVYILSDCHAFFTDPYPYYFQNLGGFCQDSVVFNPHYTQGARDSAIYRIDSLAQQSNSTLIGFFSLDDANMFNLPSSWSGSTQETFFNNNIDEHIANLVETYETTKEVYPNSIVYMNIAPIYYPRVVNSANWPSMTVSRQNWINDAIDLAAGGDVFTGYFFNFENRGWSQEWRIFDTLGTPNWYLKYLDIMFDTVLSSYEEPKALLGGWTFDNPGFMPLTTDPTTVFNNKMKWGTYVGLAKGATGLTFFGWHVAQSSPYSSAWDYIQTMVDTLANVKNLDALVFTKTNSGPVGHSLSGSVSQNISYAVYKVNGNWNEYYLLVTNNPNGSIDATPESNNTISITTDVNLCYYDIKEVFSNNTVTPTGYHQFQYIFPWFGTALFHVKLKNPQPKNCAEERPGGNENEDVPKRFYIQQNYPNPFNPTTEISFGLPKDEWVTIEVYNSIGQKLTTLLNENRPAGKYSITFDARNYASGVYIYKIKAGSFTETKKMLLVK